MIYYIKFYKKMEYTIVTAFYLMNSKFNPNKYKEWIINFLNLKTKCVLFTNKETKEWFDNWVSLPNNIKVEMLEFDEFITAKYDWNKQYEMDIEKEKGHSRELYMVWNEKINFLKKAIMINHYQTKWFIWCDIGSMRTKIFNNSKFDFTKSKTLGVLDETKSYFFRIFNTRFSVENDKFFIENKTKYVEKQCDLNIVQGGFILTNIKIYEKLHTEFYGLFHKLYNNNLFVGKDQLVYLSLVTKSSNTKVIEIISNQFIDILNDVWFFPYTFLHDFSIHRFIDMCR